jgi:iron(III) transport system permease protein
MGTTAARKFFTITLPGAKYGLISAALVVFTLVITDFGIPKVIGGNFNVLATDVFKLVIGQQDFQGCGGGHAAAGAGGADLRGGPLGQPQADGHAHRACRALPPKPSRGARRADVVYCCVVAPADAGDAGHGGVRVVCQLLALQPAAQLRHYTMGLVDAEVGDAFVNSLKMAAGTAVFGTALVFVRRLPAGEDARVAAVRRWCACWPCCRWRCRAWCWAWATSSSSTSRPTRSTGCTTRSRC